MSTETWDSDHRGAYLGNGFLGERFLQSGGLLTGAEVHSYASGHYQNESIVAMPSLLPLQLQANHQVYGSEPTSIRSYRQELRLREGILRTVSDWDPGTGKVRIETTTLIARQFPELALVLIDVDNTGMDLVEIGVPDDGLPPSTSAGGDFPPGTFEYAAGELSVRVMLQCVDGEHLAASNPFSLPVDGFRTRVSLPSGKRTRVVLATHVGRNPGAWRSPLVDGAAAGEVQRVINGHRAAWGRLWRTDIQIEGDPEAQQVTRACLYQLLCGTRGDRFGGIPPMGFSSNAFNGHVFWDMDSWMVPALLPQRPELARAMLEYRFRTLPGARANARAARLPGASYAWESGRTGRETLQDGEFVHGRHVSGDVSLAIRDYFRATGDLAWLRSRGWPILRETAENWVSRVKKLSSGPGIPQVTTPDELAGRVDQSAWTHWVARENLRFAAQAGRLLRQPVDPRWERTAGQLTFLRKSGSKVILAYEGFTDSTRAKQADALLLLHPGGLTIPEADAGEMYDYYAPRVIENGPAMTDAIHAIVAARLGRGEEALRRFRLAYAPFVRPPFHSFSEKRTRDNLCFLTGAAGVVEAVLYGFAGLRLESDPGIVTRPVARPNLPPGWSALRISGIRWRSAAWDLELRPGRPATWRKAPR